MKKIFLIILFLCLICCGCGKKQPKSDVLSEIYKRDKIIVGVREDAAPFGYRDNNGNLQGFDIDLAKTIAKSILGDDKKLDFVIVNASNRIMKLASGEVDLLIATMSITPQRQQILDFSIPYYVGGQAIMVNNNSKATGLRDFQNKKLIIVFGSTSERNIRSNVPEISILGFRNYDDAYKALKNNQADGMIADDSILLRYFLKDKSLKILKKRYSKEPYAVVFRKEPESERLLTQVNYVMDNLKKTGKLNRMLEKWQIIN